MDEYPSRGAESPPIGAPFAYGWFKKEKTPRQAPPEERRIQVPEGLWVKCDNCKEIVYKKEVPATRTSAPSATTISGSAPRAVRPGSSMAGSTRSSTPAFPPRSARVRGHKPYIDRLADYQRKTGLQDALISGAGTLGGHPVCWRSWNTASWRVDGERRRREGDPLCRALLRERRALIVVSCSGGARCRKGRSPDADGEDIRGAGRLDEAGIPFISC